MTPELWQLYLTLQTSVAYGEAWPEFSPDEHAIEEATTFFRAVVATTGKASAAALLIGPGGLNEVVALRRAGVDPLQVLTAYAPEAEAIGRACSDVSLVRGEIHDMALPTASVDLVYASNVLEHAFAPYIALMECRRVLRDDGRAYFIVPSFAGVEGGRGPFHLHCLTAEVWEELLRKTGYELIEKKVYGHAFPEELRPPQVRLDQPVPDVPLDQPHYLSFLLAATTPPVPHAQQLERLIALKRL